METMAFFKHSNVHSLETFFKHSNVHSLETFFKHSNVHSLETLKQSSWDHRSCSFLKELAVS